VTVTAAEAHLDHLRRGVEALGAEVSRLERWGSEIAAVLSRGGRLLAAGNGGSAAEAQHLTSELVGRYRHDRPPYSAIALHADTSTLTAVVNDYGADAGFARQVAAHGRPGDILVCLSTSGRSANLLAAVAAARAVGAHPLALTGPAPNPLADACDDAVTLEVGSAATVQELQLVAIHILCEAFDQAVAATAACRSAGTIEGA